MTKGTHTGFLILALAGGARRLRRGQCAVAERAIGSAAADTATYT